jgi:hypothetical protein
MAPEFRRRVAVAIQSYEDALEAQDIDALRRVWRMSSRDARAIDMLFRTSRTIDVRLQVLDVTATSDTRAVARAIETRTIVTSERETARRLRGEKVFYLERSGESWIIVDIISRSAARP